VWLNVLRTCVCIAVFDFRGYDLQLKTELHFRGSVNNNAFKQSCTTTVMHYLLSTLHVYSILLDAVSDYHVTPRVKTDNSTPELRRLRALTIFTNSYLVLDGNKLQQLPPHVFSSLTSLRSHVWLCVMDCVCLRNILS
jgi:hypothetical protein